MSKFTKTGVLEGNLSEPYAYDLLYPEMKDYTSFHPFVLTGKSTDIIATPKPKVAIPSEFAGGNFYLLAKCTAWSPKHGHGTTSDGKGTIWLYLDKTAGRGAGQYDSPQCYYSGNWISEGVWKMKIDAAYKEVSIRFDTYSDGTKEVSAKFWDIHLIPEKYYLNGKTGRVHESDLNFSDFIEY